MTQEDGPKLLPNALFIKYPNLFYISYHLIFPSLLVKVRVCQQKVSSNSKIYVMLFRDIFK